jgi:Carboxypeptidase regulatory-like domain/TonB-dependent Receptor Plug Domain/TonB dependent receptor
MNDHRRNWLACLMGILALVGAMTCYAQTSGSGAITGTVRDASGSVVPQATVVVTNMATGALRTVPTNDLGTYIVGLLTPGSYSVAITKEGFEKQTQKNVEVIVTEVTAVDVTLKIGSVNSEVVVTANTELTQTTSASLGRVVSSQVITALPLANRNFTQILGLSTGVSVALPDAGAIGKNDQDVSANGVRQSYNNFQYNGVDANNIAENSATGFGPEVSLAIPAPDTIEEFKVQTGIYDASSGRSAGANVDIVSKSGTNRFHGAAWEFFRNDDMNANTYFLKQNGQPRPVLKQNQFGGTLGGPIRRDKTFFFVGYQGTRQSNGLSTTGFSSVFLPQLTNDRSPATLGAEFGGQSGALGGVAVASNGSNINPIALALLQFKLPDGNYLIPTPQVILPSGTGQSSFSSPATFSEDQETADIDHMFNPNDVIRGRFFNSLDPQSGPFAQGNDSANVPGFGLDERDHNLMTAVIYAHTFKPTLINQVTFGYVRFSGSHTIQKPVTNEDIGLTPPTGEDEIPTIVITNGFDIGPPTQSTFLSTTNTYDGTDIVSWSHGRNYWRFGFEGGKRQVNFLLPFEANGLLNFLSFPDFLLGMSGAQNGTAFSNLSSAAADVGLNNRRTRYNDFSAFAQDDIKLRRNLTVNAGIRWEYYGPATETQGLLSNFIPSLATANPPASGTLTGLAVPSNYTGSVPTGVTKLPTTGLWNSHYADFAPRLGFALQLKNNFVIRGGYGIYFQMLSNQIADQTIQTLPNVLRVSSSGSANVTSTFQQPFNPLLPPVTAFPVYIYRTPTSAQAQTYIYQGLKDPHTQQYSFGFQYQFASDFLLDVGYVGSDSSGAPLGIGYNQPLIATASNPVNGLTTTTVANLTQRVPYLGVSSGSSEYGSGAYGNYNSLQASVTKRLSRGLAFLASYTWSKNLDISTGANYLSSEDIGGITGNQTDPAASYGPADDDRTNRFVLSFDYTLPKANVNSAFARAIISDWTLGGITVLQSGSPISVTDSRSGTIYGRSGFAQCTGIDPNLSTGVRSRLNAFINTAAFAPPPTLYNGTGFGNCSRNIVRGPNQKDLDLSLRRNFPIAGDKANVQFRAEAFNLTNRATFGQPAANLGSPSTFGVISTTVSNPRILQLALKIIF